MFFYVILGPEVHFWVLEIITHISPTNPRWPSFLNWRKTIFVYYTLQLDMCNLWFLANFGSGNSFPDFCICNLTYIYSQIEDGRRFHLFEKNNLGASNFAFWPNVTSPLKVILGDKINFCLWPIFHPQIQYAVFFISEKIYWFTI